MARLITVGRDQVKTCDGCGCPIAFHRNRDGKAYPVEVYNHPGLGMVYRSGIGAYRNLTPWHNCQDAQRSQAAYAERRAAEELDRKRNEVASRYVPRLMELAQNYTPDRQAEAESLAAEYKAALEAVAWSGACIASA